ncbi:MAG TPA: S8 family peptidase [Blastocatellia bacterium]|nr:S8 family peptidase [Blastocatellia bacterium]
MKNHSRIIAALLLFLAVSISGPDVHSQRPGPRPARVEGQILVKVRSEVLREVAPDVIADQVLSARSARVSSLDIGIGGDDDGLFLVQLDGTVSVEEAIDRALQDPRVEYAEPNYLLYTQAIPNDPFFDRQWGLFNTGASSGKVGADIGATRMWDISQGSDDIVVAVIDTGIDVAHPDLAANIWVNLGEIPGNGIDDDANGFADDINGWDFALNDPSPDVETDFHGTHVAGTVGAVGNNNLGVTGVAWRVKLMALKFIRGRSGDAANAVKAINYAVDQKKRGVNVRVINASWSGDAPSKSLRKAIKKAGKAGILFVCAAGNGGSDFRGDDIDVTPEYPAAWSAEISSIVTVAALDRGDNLAGFSNFGRKTVNVGAPGVDITSTLPGGAYGALNGTSMATPHVAGAAVLILSQEPNLTPEQVRERMVSKGEPVLTLASKSVSSARMNVFNASTNTSPSAPALGINQITANKKLLIIDGLGFVGGSTQIEINGVPAPKVKYLADFSLPGGTLSRITSKIGKDRMDALFPRGAPVTVTVVDPVTGERFSFSFTRF